MTNRVTAVMLAAAHMKPAQIYQDIQAREQWPYKADTPEQGLDIPRIHEVARQTRGFQYVRDAVVLIASFIGFTNLYTTPSPEEYFYAQPQLNWWAIALTLAVIAAAQFIFMRAMRERARGVLREIAEEGGGMDANPSAESHCSLAISGGYSPFVGSGFSRRNWSFTVDLQKPANAAEPVEPLAAEDLYQETAADIEKLGLPRLKVSDVVCVDGRDASFSFMQRPGSYRKPPCFLPAEELAKLVGRNHTNMRHYKVLRANLWGGQLVFSVFFRYVTQGDLLFVESRIFALPPLKREFMEYEGMPDRSDAREIRQDIMRSVLTAPIAWIPIVGRISKFVTGGAWLWLFRDAGKVNADAIDRDRKFNYGWPASLREQWAASEYERFFQEVDIDFYEKSITDALLESLLRSLQKRNISSDDFKQASTTIFNAGIMMSGGKISAESVAAGAGATAFSKVLQGARAAQNQKASARA